MFRLFYLLFTMPIHSYDGPWPTGKCTRCGHTTGLDDWQLEDMPKEMAYCSEGEKRAFRFANSFNCSGI